MHFFLELNVSNLLQQCTFKQLKQIHTLLITTPFTQNKLIQLKFLRRTTEFGAMEYSNLIFSQMGGTHITDITLWNAMIRGYAYNGPFNKCLYMFDEMSQRGLKPNNFTYPYVLGSCLELGWFRIGEKVQSQIIKCGFDCVLEVAHSIFDFYMKMGKIYDARKVFDDMCVKRVEFWNRMISGYVGIGEVKCARGLFDEMPERDLVSWNSMISGYARDGDVENARDLFERMGEKNIVSWTSMIGVYVGRGDVETARILFDKMPERNVVSWNSMISGYTQNGEFRKALELFLQMRFEGVNPDGFTFVSTLTACSHLGDLEFGKWVHSLIEDLPKLTVIVGTALVEMYAKCGDVNRAFTIFIKIPTKDVFSHNVMIKSLAIHGRTEDAIKIFYFMQRKGLKPNDFTFTSALFACSHGGLVEEGHKIFSGIEKQFGFSQKLEHYGCMIDLLCRNGQLEEAMAMVEEMPFVPDIAILGALMGGCRVRGDLKLAERVIDMVRVMKANESGVHVLLSNMHASVGQWKEAIVARNEMEENNVWKKTGSSVNL